MTAHQLSGNSLLGVQSDTNDTPQEFLRDLFTWSLRMQSFHVLEVNGYQRNRVYVTERDIDDGQVRKVYEVQERGKRIRNARIWPEQMEH